VPITLRANFFAVKLPKGPIYDYAVEIDPPPPAKNKEGDGLKSRIFQVLEQQAKLVPHLSYIAHDKSQRIVSARELPQPLVITVSLDDAHQQYQPAPRQQGGKGQEKKAQKAPETFAVNIKFERKLDMSHLTQ
jgi:eukaryotic translation initiation factor 2C